MVLRCLFIGLASDLNTCFRQGYFGNCQCLGCATMKYVCITLRVIKKHVRSSCNVLDPTSHGLNTFLFLSPLIRDVDRLHASLNFPFHTHPSHNSQFNYQEKTKQDEVHCRFRPPRSIICQCLFCQLP